MSQKYFTPGSPINWATPVRNERLRRFARKPDGRSERSSSRKSEDNKNLIDMYVKCPGSGSKRPRTQNQNFFACLATSIMKVQDSVEKRGDKSQKTPRTALTECEYRAKPQEQSESAVERLSSRVRALETSLELKTHESSVLAGECQRLTSTMDEEREKHRKNESEKKEAMRELKRSSKEKERLSKQVEFLERINYDDKTRSLQSYRENYLEAEMQKMRREFSKGRDQREHELENQVKALREEKFAIELNLRATKIANECLVKQVSSFQEGLQDIVLNSEEYRRLRDKYVRFLEEYKLLRSEFWALKTELHQKKGPLSSQGSEIFSITASEAENDLSEMKSSNSNPSILQHPPARSQGQGQGANALYCTWLK